MKASNEELRKLLRQREMTIPKLAAQIYSGHPHVTQVLHGKRKGTRTWNKLRKVMSAEELVCAMNFANKTLKKEQQKQLELTTAGVVVLVDAKPEEDPHGEA